MANYGTVAGGDDYFELKLRADDWENASESDKGKALFEATQIIDSLNYAGDKYSSTQELEFPRGEDTEVPDNIIKACYEIAIKLLGGFTREDALSRVGITSDNWGPVKRTYDPSQTPEYYLAGVPSAEAWTLLKPFLRTNSGVRIHRVN